MRRKKIYYTEEEEENVGEKIEKKEMEEKGT